MTTNTSSDSRSYMLMAGLVTSVSLPHAPLIDILGPLKALIKWFINAISTGITDFVANLFVGATSHFLFFKNPVTLVGLNDLYMRSATLFFAILTLSAMMFLLFMQLFPYSSKADPYRFGERALAGIIIVLAAAPNKNPFAVNTAAIQNNTITYSPELSAWYWMYEFVEIVGKYIYPQQFDLSIVADIVALLIGTLFAGPFISFGALISIGLSAIMTVLTFWLVLAMRMLLIYMAYALFPLFIAFWIVDVGPMKYAKMISELVFKVTAVMLGLGLIIAGILAAGGAITSGEASGQVAFSDQVDVDDLGVEGQRLTVQGDNGDTGVFAAQNSGADRSSVLLQLFALFGTIWLSIAITVSALGMMISTRGASGAASRVRQGRSGDPPIGNQQFGGGNGSTSAAAAGGGAGAGAMQQQNGAGGMPGQGEGETGGLTTDSMDTRTPISQSVSNVGEKVGSGFSDVGERIGAKGGDGKFGSATDKVESGFKEVGSGFSNTRSKLSDGKQWVGQKAPDSVTSKLDRGAEMAKNAGSVYGDMVRSSGGVEALQIGADGLRNSRIGNKRYDDDAYPEGISGEQVDWAPPEKIREQTPHTHGPDEQAEVGGHDPDDVHGGSGHEAEVDQSAYRDDQFEELDSNAYEKTGENPRGEGNHWSTTRSGADQARSVNDEAVNEDMGTVYDGENSRLQGKDGVKTMSDDVGSTTFGDSRGNSVSGGPGVGGGDSGSSDVGGETPGGNSDENIPDFLDEESIKGSEHVGSASAGGVSDGEVNGKNHDLEGHRVKQIDKTDTTKDGQPIQTGQFENPETGETSEFVAFGDNAEFSEGETVNVENAHGDSYTPNQPHGVDRQSGRYEQSVITDASSVEKVDSGGMSEDGSETFRG